MAFYKLSFKRSAEKELRKISQPDLRRVVDRIQALSLTPRPSGAHTMKGEGRYWRFRQGDYRVVYEINDRYSEINIVKIGHRKEVYAGM